MIFKTATPISQSNLPDVSNVLNGWQVPMTFIKVTKNIDGTYQETENRSTYTFQGVWQPFSAEMLEIKSIGERSWKWYTCHSETPLALVTDEVIQFQGVRYRVMQILDYSLYGYYEYHLVEDNSYIPPQGDV